jgi:endonuclease/exonuclease/phosphatase family metal-dependent hydrolase
MRSMGRLVNRAFGRTGLLFATLATFAAPAAAQTDVVLSAASAPVRAGNWTVVADATAVGGQALRHPNANAAKLAAALATPTHYFELTFTATAGVPYRLWLRGKADNNYWGNDSVYVQFDRSVSATGTPTYAIGTTASAEVNLEDCSNCGISGWRWQDNGWGSPTALGPTVYFAATGTQRMRVQTREDGLSIDQLVLSPSTYLTLAPIGVITPPAPQPPSTGQVLKVLDWNTHHGVGTDNVYNLQRFVTWIVSSGANVVSLNEVERFNPSWGNEDQPARYAALLTAQTGKTWYYNFAQRDGLVNGQGNMILTTFPIQDEDDFKLSYSRSVARVRILVNGISVNVFSTHLDADSATRRGMQYDELKAWALQFSEQRVIAGDFNAWPGAAEIAKMTAAYIDGWAAAKAKGVAVAYAGNEAGNTRNSRIDYIWFSKSAAQLNLTEMRVFDTRATNGVMPSDHRPIMTTFEVK